MLKCKKFVSITLAIVMTLSLSCFSVFAEESDGLYIMSTEQLKSAIK